MYNPMTRVAAAVKEVRYWQEQLRIARYNAPHYALGACNTMRTSGERDLLWHIKRLARAERELREARAA